MASTYSTNLALELIGTGDQSGTWGATTNTNLGTLLEQAISGYVTQAISDVGDTTITIPNGATGVARNMYIEGTGALTAARNLIVPANKKLYFFYNNTTGGYAVTVKVSGQTGVSVPMGAKAALVCNGTDVVAAVSYLPAFVGGTVKVSTPVFNATQTWDDAAVTFTGLKLNVTNTNSATTSLLMDLQVGGSSQFSVSRGGSVVAAGQLRTGGQAFTSINGTTPDNQVAAGSGGWGFGVLNVSNGGTPYGVGVKYTNDSPNGTGSFFFLGADASTTRCYFYSNGGLANYQANNTNLSDIEVKDKIELFYNTTLKSKAWEFGKRMRGAWAQFAYKDQTHDDRNNGYIAQYVREAAGQDFPELVEEAQWGDDTRLVVYDSDLMHIVGYNVTEAQFRIEALEAEVAALKALVNQ